MNLTGGIVLFAVIWFMVFFLVLPLRLRTQGDVGEIVHGTPAGAPHEAHLKKKVKITTAVSVVLWAIIATVILSGMVTLHDIDWFGRLDR
ncbi:DUF1467 family protein [Pseudothioclava nitratireducens]|jgi:predicted secreted protein|uniref:DUF1467 family protein n=1 Tax=Pseudothioclava nitratireducens TaxID=1928646 RepID=UPI0023D9CEDC|nr:DUF1467 family protein [Defluviimonas nitratireducens]MDF1618976.1 DUF1467 family protein [Defluviimonas nitratireducens]